MSVVSVLPFSTLLLPFPVKLAQSSSLSSLSLRSSLHLPSQTPHSALNPSRSSLSRPSSRSRPRSTVESWALVAARRVESDWRCAVRCESDVRSDDTCVCFESGERSGRGSRESRAHLLFGEEFLSVWGRRRIIGSREVDQRRYERCRAQEQRREVRRRQRRVQLQQDCRHRFHLPRKGAFSGCG